MSVNDAADYLVTYDGAVQSACWFWNSRNLNQLADDGNIDRISRIINGGDVGLEDREARYQQAVQILGA